jgi:hypothetical protein
MKTWAVLIGAALAISLAAGSAPPQPTATTAQIMQRKLSLAQSSLAAVVLEDFVTLERNARALGQLSEASNWNVVTTPEYVKHSAAFRRTSEALSKAGAARDLDTATQAYVELTLQCVQCHKYLRGTRRAALR